MTTSTVAPPARPAPEPRAARRIAPGTQVVVVRLAGGRVSGAPSSWGTPGDLARLASAAGAKDPHDVAVLVHDRRPSLVVVRLDEDLPRTTALRRAAAVGVRRARALVTSGERVAVALSPQDDAQTQAVAEGAVLGLPSSGTLVAPAPEGPGRLDVVATRSDGLRRGTTTGTAAWTARAWTNDPPNLLHPETFAQAIAAHCASLEVEVMDEERLAAEGLGGLLAVGRGSAHGPRLVRLEHRPARPRAHLALVGKGITFDSGGLDLKPAAGMIAMKLDMAGAAVCAAATRAIAELALPVRVSTWLPLAENMPSDRAFRPSDVLTLRGGTTVENGNTDAEGRLVLADALALAGEDAPDLVVDVATLTGAVIAALGRRTTGLFTDDDAVAERLLAAADEAGEPMWRLPMLAESRAGLSSPVADLVSVNADHPAGASFAAAFLRAFVPDGVPWAHLDTGGTAWHVGAPEGDLSTGGTGTGARTLVALARSLA